MGTPIRVLHICEPFNPGGVVWWLVDMAKILHGEKYRFDFLCSGASPGMRGNEVLDLGCEVSLFQPKIREVLLGSTLRRILSTRKYHVVHSHIFNLSGWMLRHAYHMGVPVRIAQYHSTHDGRPETTLVGLRRKVSRSLVADYANVLLGISTPVLNLAPRPKKPMISKVIHYGIDVKLYTHSVNTAEVRKALGVPLDSPTVGHVGRMCEVKNHKGLIDIFVRVLSELQMAELLLIGDGPLRGKIESYSRSRGVWARVRFLGASKEVATSLGAMDAFAFPSRHEGFGLAVLEARLAGVPVVASKLDAIAEVLEGCNGYTLVDTENQEEFARALVAYLRRREWVKPPESWVRRFERERCAEDLVRVYQFCLGEK